MNGLRTVICLFLAVIFGLLPAPGQAAVGDIVTVAGRAVETDSGFPTGGSPSGVARDAAGNIYVADHSHNFILKMASGTGIVTVVAGNGTPGASGDGASATAASLNGPSGLAVDAAGNIYFADQGNLRVRRVDAVTKIITTVAGNGVYGFSGDDGPATAASFKFHTADIFTGVAVDAVGNLYIADTNNHRIRRVDAVTKIITTVAGIGQCTFSGDSGPATAAAICYPAGVAVDAAGNLFLADYSCRIRKLTGASGIITTVAGNGIESFAGDNGVATAASLGKLGSMALDGAGNLYLTDQGNQRVRKVAFDTKFITTVAGNGSQGFVGDNGAATAASLSGPSGIAVDDAGNLYFADTFNSRLRKVDAATKVISTVLGEGAGGFSGDGGLAQAADLKGPRGLALDQSGNLLIAETGNGRVRRVAAGTGIITSVAGNGTPDYAGDNALATARGLQAPTGVAVDAAGNVYIADMLNNAIRMVAAKDGTITTVAGTGEKNFFGDGGLAIAAKLSFPYNLVLDGAGTLYFTDALNNRIRKVVLGSGIISTVAGNDSTEFLGDGGLASAASLHTPSALAIDHAGNLYVADQEHYRVRVIAADSGKITTVAGSGTAGVTGDGGKATIATLGEVSGLAVDDAGNLFIADSENDVVRKVSAATGLISTVAGFVSNTYGYSGDNVAATATTLFGPSGIAVDRGGNLYIADAANNRIRKVIGSVSPGEIDLPGAPGSVVALAGNARATVSFAPPAANGGSAITSFTVSSHPGFLSVTGNSSPITLTGLANGTAYSFTAVASNAAGTGPVSTPSASVTPMTLPGAPTSVSAVAGNARASVSFSPPASNGGGVIMKYTVTSSPGNVSATGAVSPIIVNGLNNGTSYSFSVSATNDAGTSPASDLSNSVALIALPTISGTPSTTALVGTLYNFTPSATTAAGFTYTGGLPPGMVFSSTTGSLSGIPSAAGSFGGIVISANNVNGAASLAPLTITVAAPLPAPAALDGWNWRDPLPQGNTLNGIVYGNGRYVAVGVNGVAISSGDGVNWTSRKSGTGSTLNCVTFGNGQFVAAGNNGVVLSSPDGTLWTPRSSGTSANLSGATFGGGELVLVGEAGTILTSVNGADWNNSLSGTTDKLNAVAYGNGSFVVGADSGHYLISGDTLLWKKIAGFPGNAIVALAYGNGRFVSLVYSSFVSVSLDGESWSAPVQVGENNQSRIAFGNGLFVSVSGKNGTTETSSDGVAWIGSGTQSALTGICYGNSEFIAVGVNGRVFASNYGTFWGERTATIPNRWADITYANGRFVAVGITYDSVWNDLRQAYVAVSTDGTTWTKSLASSIGSIGFHGFTAVAYGNGRYVGVGNWCATSTDGLSWPSIYSMLTPYETPAGITFGNGIFVAVGNLGSIATSTDGLNWTLRKTGTSSSQGLKKVAYSNGVFVAVGIYALTVSSSDGVTWTARNPGPFTDLSALVGAQGQFVAAGMTSDGTVKSATSADGIAWSMGGVTGTSAVHAVAFGNNTYLALGEAGEFSSSLDGVAWTKRTPVAGGGIYGAAFGNGTFVQVGYNGEILQSYSMAATISGTPDTHVAVGETYSFTPAASAATGFSIANKPFWASFNPATGALTGTPAQSAIGSYGGIVITASLPGYQMSLQAFAITVNLPAPGIGGTPSGSATVGVPYSFTPTATNAGSFSISGSVPPGLNFDSASGTLSGVPTAVWTYALVISASNSFGSVMLPPFTITVSPAAPMPPVPGDPLSIWNSRDPLPQGNRWSDVIYANGQFVAVGIAYDSHWNDLRQAAVALSSDGKTWSTQVLTPIGSIGINGLYSVAYGNGRFVAIGGASAISTDGVHWVGQGGGGNQGSFTGIAFGKGTFVAVGTSGSVSTTPDGVVWTGQTSGTTLTLKKVAYANGTFVAVGANGVTLSSPDGITWTRRNSGPFGTFGALVVAKGQFVAAGLALDGTQKTTTSADGIFWSVDGVTGSGTVNALAYGNDTLLALGDAGALSSSTDGVTWFARAPVAATGLYGAAYGNGTFVLVGYDGELLQSHGTGTISGTPATHVTAGTPYSFTPQASGAVSFSIANQPSWASFDASTGALTGTPANGAAGSYGNIAITANLSVDSVSLPPFSITVDLHLLTMTVTVAGSGAGTVTSVPGGIACIKGSSKDCSAPFILGSPIALQITADTNSTFGGWSVDCTGTGACNPAMTSAGNVTATFLAAPKARVGIVGFDTLLAACNAAGNGATIQAREVEFAENLVIANGRNAILDGGYNAAFSTNGGYGQTTVNGSVKIRSGRLTVNKLTIR